MSRGCIKKLVVEAVAYVFTDIPFVDSHSRYFFKKWLNVLKGKALEIIPKYGKTEAQSWPLGSGKNDDI